MDHPILQSLRRIEPYLISVLGLTLLMTYPDNTGIATSAISFSQQQVTQAVILDKIRGHLYISLLLWEKGAYDLATTHAAHPEAELFPMIEKALRQPAGDIDKILKDALDTYAALVKAASAPDKVRAVYQTVLDAILMVEQKLVGDWMNDPTFQGAVISELLEGVEGEYAEAVSGRPIVPEEYQDALGFLTVAKIRYEEIDSMLKDKHPHKREEIVEAFRQLGNIFPSITPPPQASAPSQVKVAVDKIRAELREALGLPAEIAQTSSSSIKEIRIKVERSLEEYNVGKTDEAYELAVSAYLDGFEHIEGDLLQKDRELVETLERQFKELRDGIKATQSLEALKALSATIYTNLDKVEKLLQVQE